MAKRYSMTEIYILITLAIIRVNMLFFRGVPTEQPPVTEVVSGED
jgi:hypothetical protein